MNWNPRQVSFDGLPSQSNVVFEILREEFFDTMGGLKHPRYCEEYLESSPRRSPLVPNVVARHTSQELSLFDLNGPKALFEYSGRAAWNLLSL